MSNLEKLYKEWFPKQKNIDSNINRTPNGEPYVLKDLRESSLVNTRDVPLQSTIDSLDRTLKFMGSTKGLAFLAKQNALQHYNARPETRVYNPLSLLQSVPGIRINRAVGTELETNKYSSLVETKERITGIPTTNISKQLGTKVINRNNSLQLMPYMPQLLKNRYVNVAKWKWRENDSTRGRKYSTLAYGNLDNDNFKYPTHLPQTNDFISTENGPKDIIKDTEKVHEIAPALPSPENNSDFISFNIYDCNNDKYIILRAFLSGLTDSPTSEWTSKGYIGRPEKAYTYAGAERQFTFTVKVVAFQKSDLKLLWQKINHLISLNYPDYKGNVMRGPIVKLTLGSLFKETPGFFSSITVSYDDEFPWEIKYDKKFNDVDDNTDDDYKKEISLPIGATITCTFTIIGDQSMVTGGKHVLGLPDGWINIGEESE